MPLLAVRGNGPAGAYGFGAASSVEYAMELVTPTSVAKTGTGSSTTITANGSVDFSSCESFSLNGVFSAEYDNYKIVMRFSAASNDTYGVLRTRTNGTDATGSDYTTQENTADNTQLYAYRYTSQTSFANLFYSSTTARSGNVFDVYGPFLAQPTTIRSVTVSGAANAFLDDCAGTHSLSTSYDGFTISVPSGSLTGNIAVYGLRG